jgi:hypothetical protein
MAFAFTVDNKTVKSYMYGKLGCALRRMKTGKTCVLPFSDAMRQAKNSTVRHDMLVTKSKLLGALAAMLSSYTPRGGCVCSEHESTSLSVKCGGIELREIRLCCLSIFGSHHEIEANERAIPSSEVDMSSARYKGCAPLGISRPSRKLATYAVLRSATVNEIEQGRRM